MMQIATESNNASTMSASVIKHAKNIQGLAKLASRKSIMTMAAPGMYQYPLFTSNGIETEYLMAIAKGYQLTYAANVAVAYSLNPIMDRSETPQVSQFVQKFHQNDVSLLSSVNVDNMANFVHANESATGETPEITVESATVCNDQLSKQDLAVMSLTAWDDMENCLVMESLNDVYQPYTRTARIMKEKINMIQGAKDRKAAAMESSSNNQKSAKSFYDRAFSGPAATGIHSGKTEITQKRDDKGNWVDSTKKTVGDTPYVPNFTNGVVKNQQLEAMEPTMVNVQIVAHSKGDADGKSGQSVHNITLGVKVMPRVITSDLMIASMAEAAQGSHTIFRFMKNWTKGEKSTIDFVLGISAGKAKALEKNAKIEKRFLEQSRKRKKTGLLARFSKNEVLPTLSVVITSYEASKIKDMTGIDLTQLREAIALMNRYYLLSFGIFDTEHGTLQVMFDCDNEWSYTSIGALKANVDKTKDLFNQNEILRLFGRR